MIVDLLRKIVFTMILILINNLLLLCVINILLYFINTKLFKHYKQLSWHIGDLKLRTIWVSILWCVFYIVVCIIFLFILRIFNIGRVISLVILYDDIKEFILSQTVVTLIIYSITIYSLLFLCLHLILLFKHILFKNSLRLHYYFVFISLDENHESLYLKITYFIEKIITNITLFPQYIAKPFVKEDRPELHTSLTFKIFTKSHFMARYWGIIFLMVFLVYDLFFNHFVLQYIFYIIPFVCLYQLLLIIKSFFYSAHTFEKDIACFLYANVNVVDADAIYYDNNFQTEREQFTIITDYISRGYKPKLHNK